MELEQRVEMLEKNNIKMWECHKDMQETIKELARSHKESDDTQNALLERLCKNQEKMTDVIIAWNNIRGFGAVVGFMAKTAKVILPIAALCAALWILLKTGEWPKT